ncbi:MAG: hypothetical protein GX786_09865, partial [Clostridiales bacterium]|nr:hypothetical protein [Clostridiales bacterium]
YLRPWYIPECNFSIMTPLYLDVECFVGDFGVSGKVVLLNFADFTDTLFLFFAIPYEKTEPVQFSSLSESEIIDFISIISDESQEATYEIVKDALTDQEALKVTEYRDGNFYEHLVAVYDDWVLNMTIYQVSGDGSFTEEEHALQKGILKDTIDAFPYSQRFNTHVFTPFQLEIALPEEYYFVEVNENEEYQEFYIKNHDIEEELFGITAIYQPHFEGQTIKSLPKSVLLPLLEKTTFTGVKEDSLRFISMPTLTGKEAVIFYESNDGSLSAYYLGGLKEGWGIFVSYTPLSESAKEIDLNEKNEIMEDILLQFLTME